MRILAIGDPHGKIPRVKNIVKREKPDIIICTGDFSGDEGIRKLIFKNWGQPWWIDIGKAKAREMVKKSTQQGKKVLKYLNEAGVPVYFIHGNNEDMESYGKRIFKKENLNFMHGKKKKIGEYTFIFHGGFMLPKIWMKEKNENSKKRKKEHDEAKSKLGKLFKKAKGKTVFVTHCTPYLLFDKIKNKQSPMNGRHIGVAAYREIIKEYNPDLYICGHMHENQGTRKTGSTEAVCLGMANRYIYLIDLNDSVRIRRKQIKA